MKQKTDFVTNSSSSSFVFSDKSLTIKDATIQMLDLIVKEYIEYFGKKGGNYNWLDSAKRKLNKIDPETNIMFPWSINYESFLYRDSNGYIRVDTSNNHHWEDLPSQIQHTVEYGIEYKKSLSKAFLNLQKGKVKTRVQLKADEWKDLEKRIGGSGDYLKSEIERMKKEAEEYAEEI